MQLKLTLHLFFTLIPAVVYAAANSYTDVFRSMRNQAGLSVWPVPESHFGDSIISTFGPRLKGNARIYDFHRGVDIKGDVGDDIVASFDGKVVRIKADSRGDFTVILEHELPQPAKLHDDKEETSRFYTIYMHCDSTIAEVDEVVNAGDVIAAIGDSGGAAHTPHLHQEVRLGTRCSLEYALDHPSSKCNTFDYDPHIHPLLLYSQSEVGPSIVTVDYRDDLSDEETKVVRISTPDDNPNVNVYKVSIIMDPLSANASVRDSYELDLNRRIGFNASSTRALDTRNTDLPFLDPSPFSSGDTWSIDFRIPQSWYGTKSANEVISVEVKDIWGDSSLEVFGLDETWL